ncbi:MAG: hypothetical protein ABF868_05640 [Sporolactobacillus sp.]
MSNISISMEAAAEKLGCKPSEILQLIISGHIRLCAERGSYFSLSREDVEQFSLHN